MSDLFSENEMASLSPQDKWMQENNIKAWAPGEDQLYWVAEHKDGVTAKANTKEGALLSIASQLKLQFYRSAWN
jgi:hypothetical protein